MTQSQKPIHNKLLTRELPYDTYEERERTGQILSDMYTAYEPCFLQCSMSENAGKITVHVRPL